MGLLNDVGRMKFDVRLLEWNLRNGLVTKDDVDGFLKSLPDDSGKSAPLELLDDDGDNDLIGSDGPH